MALRVDILQPLPIPGGLTATATVNQPSVVIVEGVLITPTVFTITASVNAPTLSLSSTFVATAQVATAIVNQPSVVISGNVFLPVAPVTATATVNAPTVSIVEDAQVTPTALSATTTVNAPSITTGVTVTPTAFGLEAQVIAPKLAITEPGLVRPPSLTINASVVDPTLLISSTYVATVQAATATINDPTIATLKVVQVAAQTATVVVNDPTIGGDVTVRPTALTATATVNQPTLGGDLYFSVIDPPWLVTSIRLVRQGDKATFPKQDLPHLIGTILYDWKNDQYNGKAYNLTGGTLIDLYDCAIVDGDHMFDALYTLVHQNQFDQLASDIGVASCNLDYEMDCVNTDLDEASEVLAALLTELKRDVPADLCGNESLLTSLCGKEQSLTELCGSIGYE